MQKERINNILITSLAPYKPLKIGIFGSYSRGEEKPDSDMDILVRLDHDLSLLELIKLENELSEKIGVKIDLVSESSLQYKGIIDSINKDIDIIYEK